MAPSGAGLTDIGPREHNEDHVLLRPELGLFLLADGAGGHNAGNVASALATTTVANIFETTAKSLHERPEIDDFGLYTMARRLSAAIHRANSEIVDIAKKAKKYHGMGSTIVALAFSPEGDMIHVAHVGDSRCYRMRAGVLERLTMDHSLVNDVLEMHPEADDSLVARMPEHVITRALGMGESLRVPVRTMRVVPGDLYMLCSDGLTGGLDDERIEEILGEKRTPNEHVRALVDAALSSGSRDNVAALVVECRETDVPPPRRPSVRPTDSIARPPMRPPAGSAPEIIIVGVETHVVPTNSASATLLDALGRFSRLRQPSAPEIAEPKPARCGDCGQPLEKGALFCPMCGARFGS
ncbi:MAG TPA: protein phosphatase 2C domain-containing protein [Polyangiaceae bacterium]|jgi:protein phosphatase|nr:protein phosphatase 2C domain-containing protein [Polyangiaceae bacterium]